MVMMTSNKETIGYLKDNYNDEDVIKVLIYSMMKALPTVALVSGAALSYVKLADWYGHGFVALLVSAFTLISFASAWLYVTKSPRKLTMESIGNMFYDEKFEQDELVLLLGIGGGAAVILLTSYGVGVGLIYSYAVAVALYLALDFGVMSRWMLEVPVSFVVLSALFVKLKWKKIFTDHVDWNLLAKCLCAAVIMTMVCFTAGASVARIAGYIGIEYTVALISMYILMSGAYTVHDLRAWLSKKQKQATAPDRISDRISVQA